MWEFLIKKFGDTHPSGENHEFAQNYRLQKVKLSGALHYRAVLEQAKRYQLLGTEYHIPQGFREILESNEELPTPSWEK